MRDVDIVYLYEHVSRELDVACVVTALLEHDYGMTTEIVQWPVEFPRILNKLRPRRLVVFPFCYTERDFAPLLAYWNNAHYFNLTWEQLFYEGNAKTKTPRGKFALNGVVHHAWSARYADLLRSNGVPDEHIFLNGHPAYSLYDLPYRGYFPSRAEIAAYFGLDPLREWIFFPENYNWAFYPKGRLKLFLRDDQTMEDIYEMQRFCDQSFSRVLKWFVGFLESFDNVELIIRPRPSTTLNEFRSAVDQVLKNVPDRMHIIQEGSVREWILASDITLSSYSTSLIEAAVAGKRANILEPYPLPLRLQSEWHQYLPHIRNYSQFEELCNPGKLENRATELGNWARTTLMANGDSIRNISEELYKLSNSPVSQEKYTSLSKWSLFPSKMWAPYRNLRQKYRYLRTHGVEPVYTKDFIPKEVIHYRKEKWLGIINSTPVKLNGIKVTDQTRKNANR
jgi:surface carbohydrate biosynthesis protein